MAKLKGDKCTNQECQEEGTEKVTRGTEVFYYCKKHYAQWMQLMGAMGL